MKDTNFTMLRTLNKEFSPKRKGFIDGDEVKQIKDGLSLKEMNVLELRNLRDFVVMFYNGPAEDEVSSSDKMSAITAVIDSCIHTTGNEV